VANHAVACQRSVQPLGTAHLDASNPWPAESAQAEPTVLQLVTSGDMSSDLVGSTFAPPRRRDH
jgi:hypothetical protein